MSSWWQEFFDDEYAAYGLAAGDPTARDQIVEFLIKTLELSPGLTVFDQCCGIGRLSLPLAQRGIHVIGVDQVATYIERASREAASGGLPCSFHVGDAYEFVAPRRCDAAFNWFTSFGYCEDDAQNMKMLQRAFDSLKPGGRFALDYQNVARTFADFRPAMVDRPKSPQVADGTVVLQEVRPDFLRGMMESEWTVFYPDGRRTVRRVETRLYLPTDFARMLRCCGFVDVQLFGWIDGEAFHRLSRRCIMVAKKPG